MPYGSIGWLRKQQLFEELVAASPGPPFRFDRVLVLVPSSRMTRTYRKLFLDAVEKAHGATALIPPVVQTLHRFLSSLSARVTGPALIDENTRLVLVEGIVKNYLAERRLFSQSPDLLAPSLSASLAAMIDQLAHAGIGSTELRAALAPTDAVDRKQVVLLMDIYDAYERVLKVRNLADPAGMLTHLAGLFDPSWLDPYDTIIIDNIADAGDLEAGLLAKITAHRSCRYLGEGLGGLVARAGEAHPLRITKDFLVKINVVVEEDGCGMDEDNEFLARALFSDKTFAEIEQQARALPSFGKTVHLLSAVNPREEVSFIAGEVKKALRAGNAADSLLVAFPSLDEYGPLVEEIFTDCGIPYNRALGRQLSTSPVTTAAISLLRACHEEFSGPSLLRVLSSPFLLFGENRAIAPALDRFLRDRKIMGGKERLLTQLRYQQPHEGGIDVLTTPLKDLFAALDPFCTTDPAPLAVWMERFGRLTAWSKLASRVLLIKGPLNSNLQAYKKLEETFASLAAAGRLFPEYRYTFSEWFFLLRKTLMHVRYQVPPDDEGGVQVLGLGETMGHAWSEIYLGGLIDTKFPQRLPQNIFLPESTLEPLGIRTLEKARLTASHHFYRLMLSAEKITLTWPENEGDRATVASPFLAELTPLKRAGLINQGVTQTSGIQFSLRPEDSRSLSELAKAVGSKGRVPGIEQVLNADIANMAAIKTAYNFSPPSEAPNLSPQNKRSFRVTELDDYLQCPYDYYVKHVLRLRPLEEVSEDISPLDRGSTVHAILHSFYKEWNRPVTACDRNDAQALLQKLAATAYDPARVADTFRNRRDQQLFLSVIAERFLDAEEVFWQQGMRPAFLEHKIEAYKLTLSDGSEVELNAKIDRIDVDEQGNFIVVDYKTGKYPTPKKTGDQEIFQLPVYAVMAQQALSVGEVRLRQPIGLAYYDLMGKHKGLARDVVLFNKDLGLDQPAIKPQSSPKSAEDFETILKQSMDKARKAIEGILAGSFPANPKDNAVCRYCGASELCEGAATKDDQEK
jgi:RecB family exonuclease/inactivated superfamily I helicase